MKRIIVLLSMLYTIPVIAVTTEAIFSLSKVGSEILVNTQKLYDQTLAQSAKLNNGGFVTVWVDWADSNNTTVADGSWSGIKAQVFSAYGAKAGPEILVNTATLNWQQDPRVAVLQNGNFVVTWTDGWDYFTYADHPGSLGVGGSTGDDQGKAIKAQVFSANGTPIGSEILVNTEIRNSQTAEKIAALDNGNFVVTWEDWVSSCEYDTNGGLKSCGGGPQIKAQLFNSNGGKVGAELTVTGSYNYAPKISALLGGGFVVVWHDGHYSVDDVRAQVYSAAGVKVGAEVLVNTTGAGASFSTQNEENIAALSNGGFAVTWTDLNGDDSYKGVKAQVFNATGVRVGAEILVNTTTFADQWHPHIAALKGGGFVVTWDNWAGNIDVNAQIFDNSSVRIGSEILVNTTTTGAQDNNWIAALDNGGFAVSWSENWTEVKFQVFDAAGAKIGSEILANTTTAGGQGGAQISALVDGNFMVAWNDDLYGPSDGSGSAVKAQVFAIGKAATYEDCFFSWAESNYAPLFSPAGPATAVWSVYTYRYYSATKSYLGVSSIDNHVYYLGPDGNMQDVGQLSNWLPKAGCPVPPPRECLFNWAEKNYNDLFAPAGSSTSVWTSYTFRYYSLTNTYLGVSSTNDHLYYQGIDGKLQDLGAVSPWLSKTGCQ